MRRAAALLAPLILSLTLGAAAPVYRAPRATDGHPDLQGTWTNESLTRLERRPQYGDRLVMTDDEIKAAEFPGALFKVMRVAGQPRIDGRLQLRRLLVELERRPQRVLADAVGDVALPLAQDDKCPDDRPQQGQPDRDKRGQGAVAQERLEGDGGGVHGRISGSRSTSPARPTG